MSAPVSAQKPVPVPQLTVFLRPSFAIDVKSTGLSVRVTPVNKNGLFTTDRH